jgi:type VI secretion system protein ImpK
MYNPWKLGKDSLGNNAYMITVINEQQVNNPKKPTLQPQHDEDDGEPSIANAITHYNPTTQLLLSSKLLTHTPSAGLNPLVDAAAYLFSVMGKLKHIKSYRHLHKLQAELIHDVEIFEQNAAINCSHSEFAAEYISVARYAICVTIDDIISDTPWGNQGLWDKYSLLAAFNQGGISRDSFFIILERLVRDPDIYIEVMEFMYICLSLGFKAQHNRTTFNQEQLDQIINALYKRIRAFRGNFSKILSPYQIKPRITRNPAALKKTPVWLIALLSVNVLAALFASSKYFLDTSTSSLYRSLTQTEKSVPYETTNASPKLQG